MGGDCFVCIYLVCQCNGLELGRRNRRITVMESRLGLTIIPQLHCLRKLLFHETGHSFSLN